VSYQVLARKYRPTVFAEVAGQSHVLKSLINALDNQRLHHAYLLTGTRGVGKTTLARILARCLNCEEGISSKPCGQCGACKEISEGRFIDLIEVDAASRTKVEDTRELLENVQYLPTRGRYKVYLIDEVHMLSTHSFNALLKTLEEPPEHVKFLLATTDPQKLPITVLSRCLQFNLKNLAPARIAEYISEILVKENVQTESDALWQIAMAASGSMRDALTLTDQAISYCEGSVLTEGVTQMLGVPPQQQIVKLLEAMASRDVGQVVELVQTIGEQTPDYHHTLDALLSMLHRVALAQVAPDAVDNSVGDLEKVQELAGLLSAEDVQLYYQIGTKGREDLKLAVEMRSAFEMVLLRMLVFSPNYMAPAREAVESESAASSVSEKKKPTVTISETSLSPEENRPKCESHSTSTPKVIPESTSGAVIDGNDAAVGITPSNWITVFPTLELTGISANIMANCELISATKDTLSFLLAREQSAVFSEEAPRKIAPAFEKLLGKKVAVEITIGETTGETPAARKIRLNQEKQAKRIRDFENDWPVLELKKKFGGRVVIESIVESVVGNAIESVANNEAEERR
jgi:DNA polymerase-3 subunit gamma/tau